MFENVKLDRERVYEAIAEGVERAMWRVMTNATQMPCNDFYETLRRGVADGIARVTEAADK